MEKFHFKRSEFHFLCADATESKGSFLCFLFFFLTKTEFSNNILYCFYNTYIRKFPSKQFRQRKTDNQNIIKMTVLLHVRIIILYFIKRTHTHTYITGILQGGSVSSTLAKFYLSNYEHLLNYDVNIHSIYRYVDNIIGINLSVHKNNPALDLYLTELELIKCNENKNVQIKIENNRPITDLFHKRK